MNENKIKPCVIKINNITKDYKNNRGNFNISLNIYEHEVVGLVGENGAGKTTLLRQIMGFIKSDSGNIEIMGLDAYKNAAELKTYLSYVPGEINYPEISTGIEFLHNQAKLRNIKDFKVADDLINKLQLDIRAYPKRMSKGMKQKMAIVTALMANTPIILMDEPTTGLDPLMRIEFLNIILDEKKKGKTILISSNSVEELERVCDRVALITKGKIVSIANISKIKNRKFRDYKIEFINKEDYLNFKKLNYQIIRDQVIYNQLTLRIEKEKLEQLFKDLSSYELKFISEVKYDLNKYFKEERSL